MNMHCITPQIQSFFTLHCIAAHQSMLFHDCSHCRHTSLPGYLVLVVRTMIRDYTSGALAVKPTVLRRHGRQMTQHHYCHSTVVCSFTCSQMRPMQARGCNAPLIRFLILALYIASLFTSYASSLILFCSLFLTFLLHHLSFILRICVWIIWILCRVGC